MDAPLPGDPPRAGGSPWAIRGAALIIVLAALAAYHNSFSGPFIFDDHASIAANPTIRSLWPLGPVFSPPPRAGLGGRPIFNLTLAFNYALGGLDVRGYHALDLLVHILAGLTLFGVARRTLHQWRTAFLIALVWTVHPLQTEAVTYVSQRTESLMGLFYLLTLYSFIRGVCCLEVERPVSGRSSTPPELRTEKRPGTGRSTFNRAISSRSIFSALSVAFCVLGMLTKEVMVTAPLIVLLYDRTFVSGTFREAWRRRRWCYLGLAATWILLWRVRFNTHEQGVGVGIGGTWWAYGLAECRVIVGYLRLAFWPHPLVFDYGSGVPAPSWGEVPYVLIVAALLVGSVWALLRPAERALLRPVNRGSGGQAPGSAVQALGFTGAWFFLILAPTSSVVAVAGQPMAEHRMYLPLAAVIALVACGLGRRLELVLIPVAALFIGLTVRRNEAYRTDLAIWSDTVAERPANERAQNALGQALFSAGQTTAAIARYQEAIRLKPDYPEAHQDLAAAYKAMGRLPEAVAECREAVELRPEDPQLHDNLGAALQSEGRMPEAAAQFEEALRLRPDDAEGEYNLGAALAAQGDLPGAIAHFQAALRLKPDETGARYDLANALTQSGRTAEAIDAYGELLRFDPGDAAAHNNLGIALAGTGHPAEAAAHFREAARLAPGRADYHFNLGVVVLQQGHAAEARAEFERALELKPDYGPARDALNQLQNR